MHGLSCLGRAQRRRRTQQALFRREGVITGPAEPGWPRGPRSPQRGGRAGSLGMPARGEEQGAATGETNKGLKDPLE